MESVAACGANEMACLVDFGLETETVLEALPRLAEIARHFSDEPATRRPSGHLPTPTSTEHPSILERPRTTTRDGVSTSVAPPDGGND